MAKFNVVFNEFNISLGRSCYLPFVSGLLRAYAETDEDIKGRFDFAPFIYRMDSVDNIMREYWKGGFAGPGIAAFSVSVWNEKLNLAVAAEVKKNWPHCLIVFGGPQPPHAPMEYLSSYPFIDVMIRGEGEEAFAAMLSHIVEGKHFRDIPQMASRGADGIWINHNDYPFAKDLRDIPSPYLEGYYDYLMVDQGKGSDYQAIMETNRGCPFLCTFCFYGRNQHKFKYHEMERVLGEIDWMGQNKIQYLLNADSNFGMQHRDYEIAEALVAAKKKYGFPDKFRTNFGKNADERIYQIGLLLHGAGLEKGITLARQSNDAQVLKNIKRTNIKLSTYRNLQVKFNDVNVLVYSEFIMALPGETMETWKRGLDETIESGMKNQCLIYPCMALPNTDMADPEYQKEHGYKIKRIELAEVHGSIRDPSWQPEYEDIVVGTNSLSVEEWWKMVVFSNVFSTLHGMKLGYFLIIYLLQRYGVKPSELIDYIIWLMDGRMSTIWGREIEEYNRKIDGVLERGEPMAFVMPGYGDIYWGPEEASFMRITENVSEFCSEMYTIITAFLRHKSIGFDWHELSQVMAYQKMRIPSRCYPCAERMSYRFDYNVHEYFETAFGSNPVPLGEQINVVRVEPTDFGGDKERFAREVILWGRKSGKILNPVVNG